MGYQVQLSTDDLARDWPSAGQPFDGHGYIFQTWDFLQTWADTIGAARDAALYFVRVYRDGAPLLFAPLAIEKRRGVRVLGFPDGGVVDYNAPIVFRGGAQLSAADMQEIWRAIARALPGYDVALFDKMPQMIGAGANPFRFLASGEAGTSGHVAMLTNDWATFAAQRLHRAKDSRRKRRRLAELGPVRMLIARDGAEAQRMLDTMIAQKTQRYLATRGADGFDRPGYRAYFRAMTERFHGGGIAQVSALEVAGEPVATHWGLVTRERFYCLMLAHAESGPAVKYSPGRILIENLMAWCCEHAIAAFDFGFGDAPWKDFLCDVTYPLSRGARAATALGLLYVEAADLRRLWRGATAARTPPDRGRPAAPSLP